MSAKKILVPYNFNKNEIQNAVLQLLAADPGSPIEGQVYHNSVSHRPLFYSGSAFLDLTARANHSGTQAWSTITATPTTLSGYGITDAQALDADLTALAALSATAGMVSRTGADAFAVRTIASSTAGLVVTNGDGAAGAPSFAVSNVVAAGNSGFMTGADKTKLDGVATGATANSSDATLEARANHTGTQTASTISDLATVVKAYRLDEFVAPTASVSMGSHLITNVLAPVSGTDAANKQYVDDAVAGLSWKNEARLATTVTGTLATAYANGSTIDAVSLVTGDRILIKDQSTGSENGIYIVQVSGAPVRATDADSAGELNGAALFITNGTANGGKRFVCNTSGTITVGTTATTWVSFDGGTSYTAGNGLSLTTNAFAVVADTGIVVTGSGVKIDVAVVARKVTALIGNGSLTACPVTHSLANQWVTVQVFEVATLALVDVDVVLTDTNTVTINFTTAPTTNQFRVVIIG